MTKLVVHSATRLEALAASLGESLATTRPHDPLEAQTVVVAHAGMGRWLRQYLALHPRRDEPRGVVANLDLILPFEWLDRLERTYLEPRAVAAAGWQREQLRWHVDAALAAFEGDAALAQALLGSDSARQRFRLADRMASLFAQYLLYRRELVAGWEAGREAHWQARLWRALRRRVRGAHRGDTLSALRAALQDGRAAGTGAVDRPHFLFGFNHLPPDHVALVDALARRSPVHLFHPTPTFELWGDLATERAIAGIAGAAELHFDSGHPLLAALGGHGQSLAAALEARSGEAQWHDALDAEEAAPAGRLGVLQDSLRHFAATPSANEATSLAARDDASLRVHVCHTRLRELEAVRDAILARMLEDSGLAPRDIVVMAPDVDAYARLLPAVFGDPSFAAWLPYQCADRAAGTQPLLAHVDRLLSLDRHRLTVEDLLDLLALPAVARRLGANASSAETLAQWARSSGVAWGLDGRDRDAQGSDQHTWQFALDRLTAGYLAGDDEGGPGDGTAGSAWPGAPLPIADAGTDAAADLAVLAGLSARLRAWRDALEGAQPVAVWVRRVRQLVLEALFDPSPDDAAARADLAHVHAALASVAQGAELAGRHDAVPFATVREALSASMAGAGASQPFLSGGITVCGMVPARALPFAMVCVLGLNDGEFPRIDRGQGLDLMQAPGGWRRGDRNQRDEDRYLFLEAILSARKFLHLSYRGQDPHNGEPLAPSAPLAELMAWLDSRSATSQPYRVEQPLQPFAARAFDQRDAALAGFDARWRDAAVAAEAGPRPAVPFLAALAGDDGQARSATEPDARDFPTPASGTDAWITLDEIRNWLREPGRAFVRATLDISQPWLEQSTFEEPLDANLPRSTAAQLDADLLDAYWDTGALPDELPAAWRGTGVMPPGAAGVAAFDRARARVAELTAQLDALGMQDLISAGAVAVDVEYAWADTPEHAVGALRGRIDDFVPAARTLRRIRRDERQKLGLALCALFDWAVLRLSQAPDARLLLWPPLRYDGSLLLDGWLEPAAVPPERLRAFVAHLCRGYADAQARPLMLPARTATEFLAARAAGDDTPAAVLKSWRGDAERPGECGYSQWALLTRGAPLLDDEGRLSPTFLDAAAWARAALSILSGEAS